MKKLIIVSLILNMVQLCIMIAYRIDYGAVGEHKDLCEHKLEEGNAPRNIECVLAKEVFVPSESSN